MQTDYDGELNPQLEEGITNVQWKDRNEAEIALSNSFKNIKFLLEEFYKYNPI